MEQREGVTPSRRVSGCGGRGVLGRGGVRTDGARVEEAWVRSSRPGRPGRPGRHADSESGSCKSAANPGIGSDDQAVQPQRISGLSLQPLTFWFEIFAGRLVPPSGPLDGVKVEGTGRDHTH